MNLPPIYLASGSPRRRELLTQIGVSFDVLKIDIDESPQTGEAPEAYVRRVAIDKAKAGLILREQLDLRARPVLSANTSVVVDNAILGKPANQSEARQFIQRLSGRQHQVISAVALATDKTIKVRSQLNTVRFARLSEAEIDWYVASSEGKAK